MDFKRARTDEQKRQRLQSIVQAVDGLLDRCAYREITMAMVADELGFSRANLVHYVKTKEEIFLLLYLHDLKGLHSDVASIMENLSQRRTGSDVSFEAGIQQDVVWFAGELAAACVRHRNVGRIGALLTTIIETNVDIGRLKEYKRCMLELAEDSTRMLVERFPFLSRNDSFDLTMTVTSYAAGLYPNTHPTAPQCEALCDAGFGGALQDYETMLRRFLTVQLSGYYALREMSS